MNKAIAIGIIVGIGIIFVAVAGIFSSDDVVQVEETPDTLETVSEPESSGRNIVVEFQDGLAVAAKP